MKEEKKQNIIIFIIVTILFLLSFLGLSNFSSNYLAKQIIWLIVGIILLIVIKKINIKHIIKYSFFIYLINVSLLVLVLIIGRRINGAKAWFTFGMFSIQPSELMKISLSLIYYKIAKANKKSLIKLLEIFLLFLVPSFLVFLEPDTGSIIMYFIIMLVALFNSRIKKKYLITISIIGISMVLISTITYLYNPNIMIKIFGTSIFYRLDRIIHFKDNYQLNQALIYLGSAGLFGHKDILYIPEAHTDFIFSFLIGRYGIILGIVIILCYLLLDLLLVDKLKKNLLLKFFLSTFLFSQMQNLLMNIGLLPIMGIPLPFLSYGGTNTIISIVFLGISLNKKS